PQVNSVTLEIPVKVEWDLLTDGKIPETSVTVELFQDEKEKSYRTESVGADESWQGTFTKLAKGHEYKKAKAEEIEGFTVTTELKEENGKKYFLVKYVQLPSLTISKTLIEEGKEVE
ncbi:Cna B-type domain-containing protein, partial [Streptococcus suis]